MKLAGTLVPTAPTKTREVMIIFLIWYSTHPFITATVLYRIACHFRMK